MHRTAVLPETEKQKGGDMKFSDLFVPRWQNSNPEIRRKAVLRSNDMKLLSQISEQDVNLQVRQADQKRIDDLKDLRGIK